MYSSSVLLLAFVLFCTVKADSWDDFTNNLATDLTPLLALFGEVVTKQYMSESLTLLDNFIFAMLPLGIITAVVSAIRVCGGSSLRAFIGRAQEGRGVAEAELCSSTSLDVCELWNNGGFIRTFGRPKILELVHDQSQNDFYDILSNTNTIQKPITGLLSFKHYLRSTRDKAAWEEIGVKEGLSQEELESGSLNQFAPSPNLSLNIGIKKQPLRLYQAAAVLGFALQSAMLVFAFLAVYVLHLRKNGQLMRPWSLPLTFTGTILLCFGMFLCAYLVEQSTSERVFRLKKSAQSPPLMYWLQPGSQVIGDQTFDAFAHRDTPAEYVTSWKAEQSTSSLAMRLKVWAAVGTTISGFVLQFVGLRGMHSSISLIQLGGIMIMAFVRASLRTQRVDQNDLEDLSTIIQGHELDWLAIHIESTYTANAGWPSLDGTSPRCWKVLGSMEMAKVKGGGDANKLWVQCNNKVVLGGVVGHTMKDDLDTEIEWIAQLQQDADDDESQNQLIIVDDEKGVTVGKSITQRPNMAARIMKYRARLARLTGSEIAAPSARWQIETRRLAGAVQKAIEGAAKVLFSGNTTMNPDWQRVSTILWAINVNVQQESPPSSKVKQLPQGQPVYLTLRRAQDSVDGSWKVDESELEAVLGLWLWSLHLESPAHLRGDDFDTGRESPAVMMKRIIALAATNEEFEKAEMDFELWVQRETAYSNNLLKKSLLQQCPDILDELECPVRYFGLQAVELPEARSSSLILSVTTSNSLAEMCAQDIFVSFLTSITGIIQNIGGETNTRDPTTEAPLYRQRSEESGNFLLLNTQIDKIASAFVNSGLGSREEAYMCIIPSLRTLSKLPAVQGAHDSARKSATTLRKQNSWERAEKLLRWVQNTCDESDARALEKAHVDLGELYRLAMRSRGEEVVQLGFDGILWMLNQSDRDSLPSSQSIRDRYGWIALQIARERGYEGKVKQLLHAGAKESMVKWDSANMTLLEATKCNNIDVGLLLLGRDGIDLNEFDEHNCTVLSWAAANGCTEIARSLLELNVEPDPKDDQGRTPLSYAAETGASEIVQLLLARGAFPNSKDTRGRTPLSWAAGKDNQMVVRLLLSTERVTLDARDEGGKTALVWAAEKGYNSTVAMLLEKGADADALSLLVASEAGHLPVVELLLEKGANVTANPTGGSALHRAARNGHDEIVLLLLKGGASLDMKDVGGCTALLLAAASGNGKVLSVLLKARASIEMKDNTGMTPLLWAAANGHSELVGELLKAGSTIENESKNGRTALLWAAANGHQDVVRVLLEEKANFDHKDEEGGPLHWAAGNGHQQAVLLLLRAGAYMDSRDVNGLTPLSWAARNGEIAVAKLLLEQGSNPNAVSKSLQTPLHLAAQNGQDDAVLLLLNHQSMVDFLDDCGATPLHRAAENGHASTMKLLLNAGAEKDRPSKPIDILGDRSQGTPMHWAAHDGHGAALEVLIEAGANIEALSFYHRTALHLVSRYGFGAVVRQLVQRGANKEARRDTNETPLHFAVELNHIDIVTDLVDLGSDIEAQGDRGTPLHFAAALGHLDVARRLLEKGAQPNAKMHNGQTPLHRAAAAGYDAIVQLLLQAGADRSITDDGGDTPLVFAQKDKHKYVIDLLQAS
jgi:ankyrin repeat domain-containing protein 50